MVPDNRVKVAVLGASGYSGIEAVRILAGHPFVELAMLTSEHYAGREVTEVYRHMAGIDLPPFEELRADALKGRAEVIISCLPERVGAPILAEAISNGIKVIDVYDDFRLRDPAGYRSTYGADHPQPGMLSDRRIARYPAADPAGSDLSRVDHYRRQVRYDRRAPAGGDR